jgi:hypothetical protein
MEKTPQCSTNRIAKWIRVTVSLGIIGAGIYYKSWLGLLGVITLLSAFTGSCPLCLHFDDLSDISSERRDGDKKSTEKPADG